jgi:drug/metabolite transporter (DMT)-like permease
LKGTSKEDNETQKDEKSKNFLWYAVMACVFNGLSNFAIKLQQYYTPGVGENTFYFASYGTAALICAVAYLMCRFLEKRKGVRNEKPAERKKQLRLLGTGVGVGLCLAGCQYPQSFLPGYISAPVQFTVIAAGAVLLSIAIGFIKYREKPNATNIISSICCMLAIFLQLVA